MKIIINIKNHYSFGVSTVTYYYSYYSGSLASFDSEATSTYYYTSSFGSSFGSSLFSSSYKCLTSFFIIQYV